MLNHSVIMGRLTKDVELRATTNKIPVVSFTVASERDFKNQQGERETDFIDCIAWKHTAEFMNKYCKKGQMVVVDGRLQKRSFETEKGKQYVTEIVAESVYLAGSKKEQSDAVKPEENISVLDQLRGNKNEFMPLDDDDTLPF